MTDHDFITHLQTEITQFLAGGAVTPAPTPTPIPVPPSPPSTPPAGVTIVPVTWPQNATSRGDNPSQRQTIGVGQIIAMKISATQLLGANLFGHAEMYEKLSDSGQMIVTMCVSNVPGTFDSTARTGDQTAQTPKVMYCRERPDYFGVPLLPPPDAQGFYYINIKATQSGSFYMIYA